MDKLFNPVTFSSIYRSRYIEPEANSRALAAPSGQSILLYHFTRPHYREAIMKEGIKRGDVAVRMTSAPSEDCFNNAAWLTTDPDPDHQEWEIPPYTKREVRISVKLDASDPNLWDWPDLAKYLGVDKKWYDILNGTGGGYANFWYVYVNEPIAPSMIVDVIATKRIHKPLLQLAKESLHADGRICGRWA